MMQNSTEQPTPTPTPTPAPTGFTPNELVVYSQQPVLGITNNLGINRAQAEKQLTLLGLLPDQVHFIAFLPKGDPRTKGKNKDKGRKTSLLDYLLLEAWQAEGRGIYIAVNGGGHTKNDVNRCLAIFCEHDDLSKELQLELWETLGLPEPTLQIDTGGRSIHSYWVFETPIEPDLWVKEIPGGWEGIQWDLLEYANADRSLNNRNRVMRLAGAWYMTHTEEKGTHAVAQSKIVGGCEKKYTYEELRKCIPVSKVSKPSSSTPQALGITPSAGKKGSNRLDFRSVGHRLPEWNDTGRQGWATFQCPVHTRDGASHSNDHIHVNLSTGKWFVHCGCKRAEVYKTVCELVGWNPSSNGKGYDRGTNKTNGCGNGSMPPTGGGDGGDGGDGSRDDSFPSGNQWNAPVSWDREIGCWGKNKNGDRIFQPRCNFDFRIEQELSSAPGGDGGGIVLQVQRSIDSTQKRVIIKSLDYGSAKDFQAALKKSLGDGVAVNLTNKQLNSLIHVRLKEYRERGGRKYNLADRIGQQEDGTWVFPNRQFTEDGKPTSVEESGWVFNPSVGETDVFDCPDIGEENPQALRRLVEAQRKLAGSNFMRFLLCNGYVAACLNERVIFKTEEIMPIFNPYGDAGGGKTVGITSALSLVWGNSDKVGMCSASESYLYERLSRYGSIPSLWDDPPSKRREDKERMDELLKRIYGKHPRLVRKSKQHPHSSFIPTTNHACGDTLPAAKSRTVNLFFPVTNDLDFTHQSELEEAKAAATGAFRSVISIGYNGPQVKEIRGRLQKHLPTAHDRAGIHLAILTWYTQQVVNLSGLDIDVVDWVIKNLCAELNESQSGLNSIADFVERFTAAKGNSSIGTWNCDLVTTTDLGECLAIHMPSVWPVLEAGDPPPYNRSVLERVLVDKGAVKNRPAKLAPDRDSALAYQRETHKGYNRGDSWVPPKKPQPINKKCLLIPKRLWDELGLLPISPDTPPDGNEGGENELVTSGNLPVTSGYQPQVTNQVADTSSVSDSLNSSGNLVTKKNIEEKKLGEDDPELGEEFAPYESGDTQYPGDENDKNLWGDNFDPSQNLVTRLPDPIDEGEPVENTELEAVTNEGNLEGTKGEKEVTKGVEAQPVDGKPTQKTRSEKKNNLEEKFPSLKNPFKPGDFVVYNRDNLEMIKLYGGTQKNLVLRIDGKYVFIRDPAYKTGERSFFWWAMTKVEV